MESFVTFLEGIIKVPPVMLAKAQDIIASEVLGAATKLAKNHATAIKNAKQKYDVKPSKYTGKNTVYEISYDLEGLPYPFFKNHKPVLTLYFDWTGSVITKDTSLAVYFNKGNSGEPIEVIAVNPRRVLKYQHSDPSDIFYLIDTITSDVRHEMIHMVQHLAFGIDPKQTEKKPEYNKHGKDYFTSRIEFYPQIDSAVDDFLNLVKITKQDFGKAFRIYVGMDKPGFLTGMQPNPFFQNLRWHDPENYQKAIKEFYKLLAKSR